MPQPQLNQMWTKNCLKDKKGELEKRLVENQDLFLILDVILKGLEEENERVRNKKDYSMPAWSEFQADANAVDRTLKKVRSYLKFK